MTSSIRESGVSLDNSPDHVARLREHVGLPVVPVKFVVVGENHVFWKSWQVAGLSLVKNCRVWWQVRARITVFGKIEV